MKQFFGLLVLEHPVETVLADDVAHADQIAVLRRNLDREVALGHLQDEVLLLHALDRSDLDLFDERRPVVRVNDRISDCELHKYSSNVLP